MKARNITATVIRELYLRCFRKQFPNVSPPTFSVKDMVLWKKLLAEQGAKITVEYVKWATKKSRWLTLRKKFNISGYPTAGILWGFRYSFLSLMNEPQSRPNSVEYTKSKQRHPSSVSGEVFMS